MVDCDKVRVIEEKWINDYKDYENLGDLYSEKNCNQAFLCYENAIFLCADAGEKHRISEKKKQMSERDGFSVKKASIIIVSYNCMYLMQKCLESIHKTCSSEMCETIVVENASTDGVREWLVEQEDEKIILLDQNVGFPIGCNIGVEYAEEENDIFLLNNDTRMTPNALFWLRMGLYENEKTGACGCVANYCGNAQELERQFTLPNEYVAYGEKNNVFMMNPYEERNRLCGFAMLIKRCAWNETNGMDEVYTPGYLDDDDISLQLRQAGYRLLICHNSYIYHAGSQNFSKLSNLEEIITKNYLYLMNKWKFNVPKASELNQKALEGIKRSPDAVFTVLHIGAGCGTTLARIKYLYPNAEVYGVESCVAAVKVAPENINIICGDLQKEGVIFDTEVFDYVICAEGTDRSLCNKYLKEDGLLLC